MSTEHSANVFSPARALARTVPPSQIESPCSRGQTSCTTTGTEAHRSRRGPRVPSPIRTPPILPAATSSGRLSLLTRIKPDLGRLFCGACTPRAPQVLMLSPPEPSRPSRGVVKVEGIYRLRNIDAGLRSVHNLCWAGDLEHESAAHVGSEPDALRLRGAGYARGGARLPRNSTVGLPARHPEPTRSCALDDNGQTHSGQPEPLRDRP